MPRQMFEWGKKEGRQEGRQEGPRESILKVLQARFVLVSDFIRDGIRQIHNIPDLEDLVISAALVRNLEEFEERLQRVLSRKDAKQE